MAVAMVLLAKLWRRSGWGRRRTPRVQEKVLLAAGRIFCLYWVEMGFFASPGSVQDPRDKYAPVTRVGGMALRSMLSECLFDCFFVSMFLGVVTGGSTGESDIRR